MGITSAPKALYKAQQAKRKMSKIQAAGQSDSIAVLMNGLNELVEVELNYDFIAEEFDIDIDKIKKLSDKLSKDVKRAFADAKKQIEQELISSTSMEDLKGLLG